MRMTWAGVVALLAVAAGQAGCGRPPLAVLDAGATSPAPAAPPDGGAATAPGPASDGGAMPVEPPPTNPPQVGLCDTSGWCWQNPLPQGEDLVAIWGASSDDVWASTQSGRLLRRTPAGWTQVEVIPGFYATEIWGAASDDVWAVGQSYAAAPSTPAILHWDGAAWMMVWWPPGPLYDIAGSGPKDVWAVGSSLVVHWDGAAWTSIPPPPEDPIRGLRLTSVWPAGPNDVWVGAYDHLWHWNGAAWTDYPFSGSWFADLWGSAANDVYAVDGGTQSRGLLHWDGHVWTQTRGLPSSGSLSSLYRVSGTGPRDVWVAGNAGSVYSFDGISWRDWSGLAPAVQFTFAQALWAGPSLVLASFYEGGVSAFDGRTWGRDTRGYDGRMRAVSGAAADDVWFASTNPATSLLHWQGTALEELPLPAGATGSAKTCISDVWATGGGEVWFAGCGGLLGRRTPAGWTLFDVTTNGLSSVWASGPDDAWAVGDAGTALHWDGSGWSPVAVPTDGPIAWPPPQVRGSGRDDVWVLAGRLEHWDGQAWTRADRTGASLWVNAPDDVWTTWGSSSIMGSTVCVSHYDGLAWSDTFFDIDALPTVWSPGRGEAWVAAGWGLHYHDGAWEYPNLPTAPGAFGGSSADDVWAVGWLSNAILRRNAR